MVEQPKSKSTGGFNHQMCHPVSHEEVRYQFMLELLLFLETFLESLPYLTSFPVQVFPVINFILSHLKVEPIRGNLTNFQVI